MKQGNYPPQNAGEHVLIVFTGGTISVSPSRDSGGPALGGDQIAGAVRTHHDVPIEIVDLYKAMSESLTWDHLHKLASFLKGAMSQSDVCGIVVSHGTDTMEEVAYFIDLLGPWPKPIVFTGAMRHSELLSPDGPENLVDAIRVAYSRESEGRGAMIVMNQEIHSARFAVKGHSTSLASFTSPAAGAMGTVIEGHVRYHWVPQADRESYALPSLDRWPRVELIRIAVANSPLFFRACLEQGIDGVVIEGVGAGHVPEFLLPEVDALVRAGIRVWVVPRTYAGHPLLSTYGTPGSEISLQSMGVTMEDGPGYKARLRMMLEIAAEWDLTQGKAE